MNFGITRALAGVDSFAELGILLRSGRHTRAWIEQGRPVSRVPHPGESA